MTMLTSKGVSNTRFYRGPIDFILDDIANHTMYLWAAFIVENGTEFYTTTSTGYSTQTLRPGETMLIMDGNTADLVTRYKYRDVYFNGTAIKLDSINKALTGTV